MKEHHGEVERKFEKTQTENTLEFIFPLIIHVTLEKPLCVLWLCFLLWKSRGWCETGPELGTHSPWKMCQKLKFMQKIHEEQSIKCLNKNRLNVTDFPGVDTALFLTRSSLNTTYLEHSVIGLPVSAGTWLPSSPWDQDREVQPV